MNKTVEIEFSQKVVYKKRISVTQKEFNLIKDLDFSDVPMYVKRDEKLISNPKYEILETIISSDNIIDADDELLNVSVKEI